ncbi:hypothetical protein [Phytomonospora endophytica]|uniref:Uncharacterized protein n=1 Tax=Phytomonospora endophytica TaxID=714109 RepID=A0A841FBM9_9ACTN|nr:hypothetical protein [Phytomonospora endophytica]MBB6033194.1 hypothetical protein [Phytomonospora endophytica]GIG65421.1 hypothetical protein Pen01_17160 [Phytomonospora endophytica]
MSEEQQPSGKRFELSGLQVAAATAAAVTATVVASTLGVAGTIIGAVLASVISTVGSALYLASMTHTKEKLRAIPKRYDVTRIAGATPTAVVTEEHPPTEVIRLPAPGSDGDATVIRDGGDRTREQARPTGRATVTLPAPEPEEERRPFLTRWKAVALTALVVCGLTFGVVTIAEALLGQPLAGLFGQADGATGTSLNNGPPVDRDDPPEDTPEKPPPASEETEAPTTDPATPGESPSSQPSSPSPSPSSSSPSSSPSDTPGDGGPEAPDAQGG